MNQQSPRNKHNNSMIGGHHPVEDASSVKSDNKNNDNKVQVLQNELKDAEHDILDLLKQLKKVNEQNLILTKRNQKLEYKVIKLKNENRHLRLEQASSNKRDATRSQTTTTTTATTSIVPEEAATATTGSTLMTKRDSYPESTTTVTSSSVVEAADDSIKYSEDGGGVAQSHALSQDLLMYSNESMKGKQKAHSSKKKKDSSKRSPFVSSEEVKKVRHHHHHHHHRNRTGTEVQGTKSQNIAKQDHQNYATMEKIEMNQSISSDEEHSSDSKLSFHKEATGGYNVFHDQHNIDNHPLYIKYNKHSSKKKHIPARSSDEDSDNLGFAKLSIFKDNITKTKTKEISATFKNEKGAAHHFKKRRSISQPRKSLRRACLSSTADVEDYNIYSAFTNSSITRTVHKASSANNKQEETTKLFKSTGDVISTTTPVVLSPMQHRPVQRKGTPTLSRYHPLRRGSLNNNAEGSSVLTSSLLSRAASDECNNNDDDSIDKSLLLLSFDDLRSSFKESQAKLNNATSRYNPRK